MNNKCLEIISKVKEGKLYTAKVVQSHQGEDLETGNLTVTIDGTEGKIPYDEIDFQKQIKNLSNFVGLELVVSVTGYSKEEGVLLCSRAKAQELISPKVIATLKSGRKINAQIITLFYSGALLDILGVVVFMKNEDFSDDFTQIREIHKRGDFLDVKLKEVDAQGRYLVEAYEKHCILPPVTLDSARIGSVYIGRVLCIMPWGCFVKIGPDADVLCDMPVNNDIKTNQKVNVVVKKKKDLGGKIKLSGQVVR